VWLRSKRWYREGGQNGCTALVGRLDTFRILYLCEFQSQPEYELNKRARSSFSWLGDVVPEEKPGQALWSPDYEINRISRALFSQHLEHVYWKPAVEKLLDFVSSYKPEPELADILTTDAEKYIPRIKGRSLQLYSTLSKGVHWEFFTTPLVYDETTVTTAIRETLLLLSHLEVFFDLFRTLSSSLTSCKASIYPGVSKFGIRFDVFNDSTVVDISRSDVSIDPQFFPEVIRTRYP